MTNNSTRYFKVRKDYGKGEENFVQIDETELEAAIYAFLTDSKVLFKNGTAPRVIDIREDWHREMGWNPGYALGPEDINDLKRHGVYKKYAGVIAAAKEKVQYLMQKNQLNLIGKNVEIAGITTQALSPKP